MEAAEDIKKMFDADIREKKRTGTGAFHRKGKGKKHGIRGGMKTTYSMLRGKEKRDYAKAGKVRVFMVSETFLTWDALNEESQDEQKRLLELWRGQFSNKEVMAELGIGKNEFYKKLEEVGAEKDSMAIKKYQASKRAMSDKEFDVWMDRIEKKEFPTYDRFRDLPVEQKEPMFLRIDALYELDEIMQEWPEISKSVIYSLRYTIKKRKQKATRKEQKKQAALYSVQSEPATEETEKDKQVSPKEEKPDEQLSPDPETDARPEPEPRTVITSQPAAAPQMPRKLPDGTAHRLNGEYTAEELSRRLNAIQTLLADDGGRYRIRLEIDEVEAPPSEKAAAESVKAGTGAEESNGDLLKTLKALSQIIG